MAARRASDAAKPPRILVGLGETAGYCALLAEGLRAAGADATRLNLGPDPMRYTGEPAPWLVRMTRRLAVLRRSGPGPRAAWAMLHRLALAWLFLDAVRRHDAFILRAGDSFFALRDLPLLRRLGKRVIVVFFGSDSRPSYLNGAEIAAGQDGSRAAAITAAKRRMVARTERSATHVVCHPMSAQLHRRHATAFLAMGIPRRLPPDPGPPQPSGGPVRFLHAPSRPHDKGSDRVHAAIEAVRAEGLDVELRVISGRPNAEVLDAIGSCDVVIDQLYSDTPMAALAAEAASLGRPAIVGGYAWEALDRLAGAGHMPPTHRCHPDELADAVRRLAVDDGYRLDLGRRARRFVEDHWTPARVAERYLALLRDEIPDDWWFDPATVDYVLGAGAPEETVRDAVRRVLEAAGPEGLQLGGRPHLVERLLALVAGDPAAVRR